MTERKKKLASKCLLLKTPDDRCFFTEEKNFPVLVEFGRTFNAEISIVKTKEEVEIQELPDLAKSICNQDKQNHPEYEVVEIKLSPPTGKAIAARETKINQTKEVIEYIKSELLNNKIVSMIDLETKFPEVNRMTLSNCFTRVRRDLTSKGKILDRIKPGHWRISPGWWLSLG